MKKVVCVVGVICVILGFALLVSANIEIATNSRYTWERPYSNYEMEVLTVKYAGIAILISGAIDVILTVISTIYTAQTIQDKKEDSKAFLVCPACHCKTMQGATFCPNCGHKYE